MEHILPVFSIYLGTLLIYVITTMCQVSQNTFTIVYWGFLLWYLTLLSYTQLCILIYILSSQYVHYAWNISCIYSDTECMSDSFSLSVTYSRNLIRFWNSMLISNYDYNMISNYLRFLKKEPMLIFKSNYKQSEIVPDWIFLNMI